MRIGTTIRKLRRLRGDSQGALAGIVGVTAAYLSQVETEKRQPSRDLLERIAEHYDLNVDALLWDALEMPSNLNAKERKKVEVAKEIVESLFQPPGS